MTIGVKAATGVTHGVASATRSVGAGVGKMLPFVAEGVVERRRLAPTPPAPTLTRAVNAQISCLPSPLRLLHGALLATVEAWSDESVVARLPSLALFAAAESDTLALLDLADEVREFAQSMVDLIASGGELGGPLELQWRALTAMVDVSGLTPGPSPLKP